MEWLWWVAELSANSCGCVFWKKRSERGELQAMCEFTGRVFNLRLIWICIRLLGYCSWGQGCVYLCLCVGLWENPPTWTWATTMSIFGYILYGCLYILIMQELKLHKIVGIVVKIHVFVPKLVSFKTTARSNEETGWGECMSVKLLNMLNWYKLVQMTHSDIIWIWQEIFC